MLDQEVGKVKEVKLQEENGIANMKSRGLGDTIHKFTTKTGIKSVVDRVSNGLNIPCGCEARHALNKIVPYKMKRNK